jgi:hypothetical protein
MIRDSVAVSPDAVVDGPFVRKTQAPVNTVFELFSSDRHQRPFRHIAACQPVAVLMSLKMRRSGKRTVNILEKNEIFSIFLSKASNRISFRLNRWANAVRIQPC